MVRRGNPTLIRGVLYPSARAAAKALGVHENTIWHALNHGDIDHVGLGLSKAAKLEYNGVIYESAAVLSEIICVKKRQIQEAMVHRIKDAEGFFTVKGHRIRRIENPNGRRDRKKKVV